MILILFVPLAAFAVTANPESEWAARLTNASPFALLIVLWLILLGIMPYRNARKAMASHAHLREPITYAFTVETISATSPSAHWSIAWDLVKRLSETKSLFLLYHAPNMAVAVPKHFFQNTPELDSWRQFAAARLGSERIEKPGIVARFC